MTSIFKLGENKIAELVIDSLIKRMKDYDRTHLGLVPQVEAFENAWGGIDVRISARSATLNTTRHVVIKEYQQQSFFRVHYVDYAEKVDVARTYLNQPTDAAGKILAYLVGGEMPGHYPYTQEHYDNWLAGAHPLPAGDPAIPIITKKGRFAREEKVSNAVLPPPPEKVAGLSPTFRF